MNRTLVHAARVALPIMLLSACTADVDRAASTEALTTTDRAYAIEGHVEGIYPLGEICVVHLYEGGHWTGLIVPANDDGPPRCGVLQPYLAGESRLLEWDPADVTAVTDLEALQNLSDAFDQSYPRETDYFFLDGPVREWLWGATYGDGQTQTIAGLGIVCALFVETDIGETLGFIEVRDASGACPRVGPFMSSFHSLMIPAEDVTAITDPTLVAAFTATFHHGTVQYFTANAPFFILQPGGTFEGVVFSDAQAIAVLTLVNDASHHTLDDVVRLDRRAADSIVAARPIASIAQLASLYWVGPSALRRLRDFECPAGTVLENSACVDDGLASFGESCLGTGGAGCETGLCRTSWDGYFCYYTACTATCETHEDCEDAAIAAGFAPQDVLGSMWCGNGVCDLTHLRTGGVTCE